HALFHERVAIIRRRFGARVTPAGDVWRQRATTGVAPSYGRRQGQTSYGRARARSGERFGEQG
ncbi:MAG: hypothetical protein M3Y74_17580, partial [Chloroflexota bacterium]|nr:hypothetical protein [Chloroflexota bacterium]